MRYLIPILLLVALLLGLDAYVYRNWRRFAREKGPFFRWSVYVYRVLLWVMPLSLPVYFMLFRWWEVEPRLARALFIGFWSVYYVPKIPIALVLLVKDAVRLARLLVGTVRGRRSVRTSDAPANEDMARDERLRGEPIARSNGDRTADERFRGKPIARSNGDRKAEKGSEGEPITRSEFIRRVGWSAVAVPFLMVGYSVSRQLYDFAIHRVDVPITGLPRALDGVTIAQLSDLHAGSLFSDRPIRDAVAIVNSLQPDVVAVTGDFVNHDVAETPVILPALNELRAELGVYGCLGNHDHYAQTGPLVERLSTTPMDLLVNSHRTIEVDGARLYLIGTDNTGFNQNYADLPRAVEGIDPEAEGPRILLAHDPTFWDSHVRPGHEEIDLMLCGHTHGGQFGMEFGSFRWSLAQLRYERWAGLYAESRRYGESPQFLYVNRGLGTVGPPLRLGIRPEITLLTLRRT